MTSVGQIEKRIVLISVAFALTLLALTVLALNLYHVGLPTCLTDIKPFEKGELITHSPTHYELHYVARMWMFEPEDVTVPAGSTVDIYLSSADVTHGLIMPGTDVNLMAVPGTVNYARVKFEKPRDYQVLCQEFCGTGHQAMATALHVVNRQGYRVGQQAPSAGPEPNDPGYRLIKAKRCLTCHSIDGKPRPGPTFKGLYGRREEMIDGSVVTVDDAYVRESIHEPKAKIVKGFRPVMPKTKMTDAETEEIIEYLKTLK
ncbi:MAG: c-type cytochrome [Chthoniobacterales bacterium]